ncbi:MAG: MFS transporter [Chloroflexi bacterium]|nr:MFS transporter [Chloroflexota bacterium]
MVGKISLRNLGTFSSLKNPSFRLYFWGMGGMMAAMSMQLMVRSLLAYRLTGSAAILAGVVLAYSGPTLFVALFGGVIADRMQKKYVLSVGLVGSALVALGIALALTLGYLSAERAGSWWIMVVAGLLQGSIDGLILPTRQAIISEIVAKEEVMNAVSLANMEVNALRFLAPAVAGFLIDALGFQAIYYMMAGLDIMGMVFIAFMKRTSAIIIRGRGVLVDIKDGLQYIRRETVILFVLLFALVTVVLSMPYQMLLPIFTDDILKVGATGLGVLMSASGVGAVVSSLFLASLPNKKRGLMMLVSSLILGIALTGFSFSSSWPISLTIVVILGLGQSGRVTLASTLLQYYSEDGYRGRVMSIFMMEAGLSSFASFAAGLLTEAIGVQWAVGGFAIVLTFISVLMLLFVPRLRRLD